MGSISVDGVRAMRIYFLPVDLVRREGVDPNDPGPNFQENFRRLERILFASATRSPTGYIRGLDNLAIVLYFIALDHFFDSWTGHFASGDMDLYEVLTYSMLHNLIVEGHMDTLLSNFKARNGILCHLTAFEHQLVKLLPYDAVLAQLGITPMHYAIRWFILLFAQEHDLPCILTLCDGLFAHFSDLADYLIYLGIAHIWAAADRGDPGDYWKTLNALQTIHWNIEAIMRSANNLSSL
jgi:hypothetical protein